MDIASSLIQTSRQSDELSEDSGIQSSPSSSKSSTPLKHLKMSKEDIEDMSEEAFKKSDNPSKKTKENIQAATGMSIEANLLKAPKKKFQYFPTAVRRKLLESYVPGGGLPPEETMKVLLKETGLTRTQICNFYSHKKRALKKEAARQNAEANTIVNEIKQKMEDDKIQDFLDKLHKEHPSSFTKEGTGPTTFLRTRDGRIRYPVPKDSSPEGQNSSDDQTEGNTLNLFSDLPIPAPKALQLQKTNFAMKPTISKDVTPNGQQHTMPRTPLSCSTPAPSSSHNNPGHSVIYEPVPKKPRIDSASADFSGPYTSGNVGPMSPRLITTMPKPIGYTKSEHEFLESQYSPDRHSYEYCQGPLLSFIQEKTGIPTKYVFDWYEKRIEWDKKVSSERAKKLLMPYLSDDSPVPSTSENIGPSSSRTPEVLPTPGPGKIESVKTKTGTKRQLFEQEHLRNKILKANFMEKQFLTEKDAELVGTAIGMGADAVQRWFENQREGVVTNFMNDENNELPWQLKKLEHGFQKLTFADCAKMAGEWGIDEATLRTYFGMRMRFNMNKPKNAPSTSVKPVKLITSAPKPDGYTVSVHKFLEQQYIPGRTSFFYCEGPIQKRTGLSRKQVLDWYVKRIKWDKVVSSESVKKLLMPYYRDNKQPSPWEMRGIGKETKLSVALIMSWFEYQKNKHKDSSTQPSSSSSKIAPIDKSGTTLSQPPASNPDLPGIEDAQSNKKENLKENIEDLYSTRPSTSSTSMVMVDLIGPGASQSPLLASSPDLLVIEDGQRKKVEAPQNPEEEFHLEEEEEDVEEELPMEVRQFLSGKYGENSNPTIPEMEEIAKTCREKGWQVFKYFRSQKVIDGDFDEQVGDLKVNFIFGDLPRVIRELCKYPEPTFDDIQTVAVHLEIESVAMYKLAKKMCPVDDSETTLSQPLAPNPNLQMIDNSQKNKKIEQMENIEDLSPTLPSTSSTSMVTVDLGDSGASLSPLLASIPDILVTENGQRKMKEKQMEKLEGLASPCPSSSASSLTPIDDSGASLSKPPASTSPEILLFERYLNNCFKKVPRNLEEEFHLEVEEDVEEELTMEVRQFLSGKYDRNSNPTIPEMEEIARTCRKKGWQVFKYFRSQKVIDVCFDEQVGDLKVSFTFGDLPRVIRELCKYPEPKFDDIQKVAVHLEIESVAMYKLAKRMCQ
ncbi:hypothetical protein CAEBREN_08295 [Caenorhabditis brenneri]|uniref:Homeobox domain-containing protein n=1 Tax=Caenorhabditis brenneri TaxID=135651 RepID=G0P5R2_CAEBE|nr:hypothetical protein CAEBREN_08295 [Caenorhabditis brenneri]